MSDRAVYHVTMFDLIHLNLGVYEVILRFDICIIDLVISMKN